MSRPPLHTLKGSELLKLCEQCCARADGDIRRRGRDAERGFGASPDEDELEHAEMFAAMALALTEMRLTGPDYAAKDFAKTLRAALESAAVISGQHHDEPAGSEAA